MSDLSSSDVCLHFGELIKNWLEEAHYNQHFLKIHWVIFTMKRQWNICTSEIDEDKLNVIGKGIQEQAKYEVFSDC